MWKNTGQARVISNFYTVKKYNEDYYTLTIFKANMSNAPKKPRMKRNQDNINEQLNLETMAKYQREEDGKLRESISRSRAKIFEYAMCNEFEYFITMTMDKEKVKSRYDLDGYIKDLGQWIRDRRKKTGQDIQYLLIPEQHKDGAWHMHGLISGLDQRNEMELFKATDKIPGKMRNMIKQGRKLYNWLPYSTKYGFNSCERVKSTLAVSLYITKYITKNMANDMKNRKNKKVYYSTRGLKIAQKIEEGSYLESKSLQDIQPFENDYIIQYQMDKSTYENYIKE